MSSHVLFIANDRKTAHGKGGQLFADSELSPVIKRLKMKNFALTQLKVIKNFLNPNSLAAYA